MACRDPSASTAFSSAVVLPTPVGPSITTPRPGDLSATTSSSHWSGSTKVCVGIPEELNTSSSSGGGTHPIQAGCAAGGSKTTQISGNTASHPARHSPNVLAVVLMPAVERLLSE